MGDISESKISTAKVILGLKTGIAILTICMIFISLYLMKVDDSIYISSMLMMSGYAVDIYELRKKTVVFEIRQKKFNKVAFISNLIGILFCFIYIVILLSNKEDLSAFVQDAMPVLKNVCGLIIFITFCNDGVLFYLHFRKSE